MFSMRASTIFTISALLLSACGPSGSENSTSAPLASASGDALPSASPVPSLAPVASPSPSPTAEPINDAQAELNRQGFYLTKKIVVLPAQEALELSRTPCNVADFGVLKQPENLASYYICDGYTWELFKGDFDFLASNIAVFYFKSPTPDSTAVNFVILSATEDYYKMRTLAVTWQRSKSTGATRGEIFPLAESWVASKADLQGSSDFEVQFRGKNRKFEARVVQKSTGKIIDVPLLERP